MAVQEDLQRYTADSGRDWNQMCMALVSHYYDEFGHLPYYAASANDGYYASKIESYDAYSAPVGATIWLEIGTYGHVIFRVDDSDAGGTSHLQVPWGINAGLSDLGWYCSQTGATPRGWSWDVVGGSINYESRGGGSGGSDQEDEEMGIMITTTSASSDGVIGKGHTYWDSLDGPLTLQTADEVNAHKYFKRPVAEWSGNALRNVMKARGRYKFSGDAGKSDYGKVEY